MFGYTNDHIKGVSVGVSQPVHTLHAALIAHPKQGSELSLQKDLAGIVTKWDTLASLQGNSLQGAAWLRLSAIPLGGHRDSVFPALWTFKSQKSRF